MMAKEDIVYISLAILGGAFSAISAMALRLHVKTFNLCCNVVSFTRSISSNFRLSKFASSDEKSNSKEKNNDYV